MTTHPADSHDIIRVVGARENTLRSVDVDLPKRRLTVFTGVSGSGKSSLVFSTIAAESQRMINETYSAFLQGFMPTLARPEVDLLEGLTTAIVVDQERMGSDPRSTVGTATDTGAMLRILFSRLATPHIGGPKAYSFNVASASGSGMLKKADGSKQKATFTITGGMCVRCEGRGSVSDFDVDALVDRGGEDGPAWDVPPVISYMVRAAGLTPDEAYKTFNMGVGLSLICAPDDVDEVCEDLEAAGFAPFVMGECVAGEGKVSYR